MPHADTDTEQLICALMFLMTRQVRTPEKSLSAPIREHLQWLAAHPDTACQPMLRKTCKRLLLHWEQQERRSGDESMRFKLAPDAVLH